MSKPQPLIGGLIAGKVIEMVVGRALDRVAKSPSISLQKPDVPAVR
jgi:F0F1-type ATP synthase membrane subunit c/vacuolar-type H+-ATPase subunit K